MMRVGKALGSAAPQAEPYFTAGHVQWLLSQATTSSNYLLIGQEAIERERKTTFFFPMLLSGMCIRQEDSDLHLPRP